jgi:hypothetical protein
MYPTQPNQTPTHSEINIWRIFKLSGWVAMESLNGILCQLVGLGWIKYMEGELQCSSTITYSYQASGRTHSINRYHDKSDRTVHRVNPSKSKPVKAIGSTFTALGQ